MTRSALTLFLLIAILGLVCGILSHLLLLWIALLIYLISTTKSGLSIIMFLLIFVAAGYYSHHTVLDNQHNQHFAHSTIGEGNKGETIIKVHSYPETKDGSTSFIGSYEASQKPILIKIKARGSLSVLPGDHVRGNLYTKVPERFDDSPFDYPGYLGKDNVFLTGTLTNPLVIPVITASPLYSFWKLRSELQHTIFSLWPGDNGALVAGILLGTKEGLSAELTESLKITGLSHIIAISGYNITIIILCAFSILKPLPKKLQITLAILFIICFALFVGGSAAVVRASIMGIIGLLALSTERKSIAINSLLLSGVIMGLWNPLTLIYDIGFQLSFGAVFGLLYAEPILARCFFFVPKVLGIYEGLVCTLAALSTTLPLTIYYFGVISLISPLANILIGPLVPISMLISFLAVMTSLLPVLWLVTVPCSIITTLLLRLVIEIIHLLAGIPLASITLPGFPPWWFLAVAYLFIYITLRYCNMRLLIRQ